MTMNRWNFTVDPLSYPGHGRYRDRKVPTEVVDVCDPPDWWSRPVGTDPEAILIHYRFPDGLTGWSTVEWFQRMFEPDVGP